MKNTLKELKGKTKKALKKETKGKELKQKKNAKNRLTKGIKKQWNFQYNYLLSIGISGLVLNALLFPFVSKVIKTNKYKFLVFHLFSTNDYKKAYNKAKGIKNVLRCLNKITGFKYFVSIQKDLRNVNSIIRVNKDYNTTLEKKIKNLKDSILINNSEYEYRVKNNLSLLENSNDKYITIIDNKKTEKKEIEIKKYISFKYFKKLTVINSITENKLISQLKNDYESKQLIHSENIKNVQSILNDYIYNIVKYNNKLNILDIETKKKLLSDFLVNCSDKSIVENYSIIYERIMNNKKIYNINSALINSINRQIITDIKKNNESKKLINETYLTFMNKDSENNLENYFNNAIDSKNKAIDESIEYEFLLKFIHRKLKVNKNSFFYNNIVIINEIIGMLFTSHKLIEIQSYYKEFKGIEITIDSLKSLVKRLYKLFQDYYNLLIEGTDIQVIKNYKRMFSDLIPYTNIFVGIETNKDKKVNNQIFKFTNIELNNIEKDCNIEIETEKNRLDKQEKEIIEYDKLLLKKLAS